MHEHSIEAEFDGRYFILPTVISGKRVSNEEAIRLFKTGELQPLGEASSRNEATRVAQGRSRSFGKMPFDPEQYQGLFSSPDIFQTDPSLGLTSGATAPDPGIGMASAPSPVAAAAPPVAAAPQPQSNVLGNIGLALEAFGAAGQGRTPLYIKLKQQEQVERQRKLQEMLGQLKVATELSTQAALVPEEQRPAFIKKFTEQFAKDDPVFADFLTSFGSRPDLISTLPQFIQSDPVFQQLAKSGDKKALNDYLKTQAGREQWNQAAVTHFAPKFQERMAKATEWYSKNKYEDYKEIAEDGVMTMAELRRLNAGLPEGLQSPPDEFASMTAPENQEALISMFEQGGLKFVPDKTLSKFQTKEEEAAITARMQRTELAKLQDERAEVEDVLKTATGKERNRLERNLKEINQRIQDYITSAESTFGKRAREDLLALNTEIDGVLKFMDADLEQSALAGTGLFSALKAVADKTLGTVVPGQIAPEAQLARQKLREFNQIIKPAIVNNPKFPVYEQKLIEKLVPSPDQILINPETALENMKSIRMLLQRLRVTNERSIEAFGGVPNRSPQPPGSLPPATPDGKDFRHLWTKP